MKGINAGCECTTPLTMARFMGKTYKFLSSKPGYVSWRKKICENYTQNKSVTNLLLMKFVSYENFVGSFMDR